MRKNDSGWRWYHDTPFLLCLAVITVVIGFLFWMPNAKAESTNARGVLCDTAEEIEAYVTLAGTGTPPLEALEAVNTAAKKEHACVFGTVAFAGLREVKPLTVGEHELVIVEIALIAVQTPQGFMPVAMTQFMVVAQSVLRPTGLGI